MEETKWTKSLQNRFSVKYDGLALKEHEMDLHLLAESMEGIDKAINAANIQLNGANSNCSLKVIGSPKSGSLEVEIISFLTSDGVNALNNVLSIIGFIAPAGATLSLIQLIKLLKGQEITDIKNVDDDNVELKINNHDGTINVSKNVYTIYGNATVIEGISHTIAPLCKEGITDMEFSEEGVIAGTITKDDIPYFPKPESELLEEKSDTALLRVTQSNVAGKKKGWRFSFLGGSPEFRADVKDDSFLKKVKARDYAFDNGTIIRARYRKIVIRRKKTQTQWEIIEVLEVYDSKEKQRQIDSEQ